MQTAGAFHFPNKDFGLQSGQIGVPAQGLGPERLDQNHIQRHFGY
jgi:hypothetical protein